jgi:tetratricopeptide (TPR) repeat protein
MTKRKQQKSKKRPAFRPPQQTISAVAQAMKLFQEGDYGEALTRLMRLAEQNPRSQSVLLALLKVSEKTKDWTTFARYSEQLLPLERGEAQADTLNNLVYAYTQLGYPGMAWQAAQELIRKHPTYPEIEQARRMVQVMEGFLQEQVRDLLAEAGHLVDNPIEAAVGHDQVRFYSESGQIEKAIPVAEALLAKLPGVIPVLNNLSMCYFMDGQFEKGEAAVQEVLAQAPENYHALSNLTRFLFLTGQFEAAEVYAARLKAVRHENVDLEVKQAEALAFLGDDEGVREAYERAKARQGTLPSLLLHLAAAAHYRLGEEKTARRLWQEAAKQRPPLVLAQEAAAELERPVGERNIPWYWTLAYWVDHSFTDSVREIFAGSRKNEKAVQKAGLALLDQYPYLPALFPHILDRGNRVAREFVVNYIGLVGTPELLRIAYDFALSPRGTDALRMKALRLVQEGQPEWLPEDNLVRMWSNGKQTDIYTMNYEIHSEPEPPADMPDEVVDKLAEVYELLMAREAETAERLLRELLVVAPDFPSIYNQLGLALEMQGRQEESHALLHETHRRFPDYFFARIAVARLYAKDKRIEEARGLLTPLARLRRLHISEFRALAQAHMDIALAEGNRDAARSWLDMWAQVEDDNPDLLQWRMRIERPDNLMRRLQPLAGWPGRKGKR